jgi:tRNA(fMet)-specific endonuclease VapC
VSNALTIVSANSSVLMRLLDEFEVLELDDRAARIFGRNQAYLFDQGTPIGDMEVLIASIAMATGEMLITRNLADFARIPGLRVLAY